MLIKFKSNNKQIIHVTPDLTLICTTPNNLILAQLFHFNHTPINPKEWFHKIIGANRIKEKTLLTKLGEVTESFEEI